MKRPLPIVLMIAALGAGLALPAAADRGRTGCTSGCTGGCTKCVPACSGSWDENKSSKPVYTMTCDYAGTRGRDPWHAPSPECRCQPPCGEVIVKKRFYKTDGPATIERVPKYEVRMVADEPCDCRSCQGGGGVCWWNPFEFLRQCGSRW